MNLSSLIWSGRSGLLSEQDCQTAANQYLAHALAVKGAGPKIRDPAVGLLCQKLGKMFWIGPGSHLDQLWGRKGGIESEAIVA